VQKVCSLGSRLPTWYERDGPCGVLRASPWTADHYGWQCPCSRMRFCTQLSHAISRTIQETIWICRFGHDNDLGRTRKDEIYVAGGAGVGRELKINPALNISSPIQSIQQTSHTYKWLAYDSRRRIVYCSRLSGLPPRCDLYQKRLRLRGRGRHRGAPDRIAGLACIHELVLSQRSSRSRT
jgi:hypothetical protein